MEENTHKHKKIIASIIIPTFNGEEYIDEILEAIYNQKTDFAFEVVIVDSGSRDQTLDIIRRYPVRLYEIPNEEFNHGDTRNLAARKAKGEFLVYLSHDATPANNQWLQNMIDVFTLSDDIANVVGNQIPREHCPPTVKKNIIETFKNIGGGKGELTIYKIKPGEEGKKEYEENKSIMRFNSDVNAAYRRSSWEKVPFRRIAYAEDQVIGQDLLEAGYARAYAPDAAVIHSNIYPIGDFLKRFFDEYRGLQIAFGYIDQNATLLRLIPGTLYGWYKDILYIFSLKEYQFPQKIYWSMHSLMMNFFRRLGAYLGGHHDKLSPKLKSMLSLEKS